jgi:hypothetical protein
MHNTTNVMKWNIAEESDNKEIKEEKLNKMGYGQDDVSSSSSGGVKVDFAGCFGHTTGLIRQPYLSTLLYVTSGSVLLTNLSTAIGKGG